MSNTTCVCTSGKMKRSNKATTTTTTTMIQMFRLLLFIALMTLLQCGACAFTMPSSSYSSSSSRLSSYRSWNINRATSSSSSSGCNGGMNKNGDDKGGGGGGGSGGGGMRGRRGGDGEEEDDEFWRTKLFFLGSIASPKLSKHNLKHNYNHNDDDDVDHENLVNSSDIPRGGSGATTTTTTETNKPKSIPNSYDILRNTISKLFQSRTQNKSSSSSKSEKKEAEEEEALILQKLQKAPISTLTAPNSTILPPSLLLTTAKRFQLIGNTLTDESIRNIARYIQNWYVRHGYVLHSVTGATLRLNQDENGETTAVAELMVDEPCMSVDEPVKITFVKEVSVDDDATTNEITSSSSSSSKTVLLPINQPQQQQQQQQSKKLKTTRIVQRRTNAKKIAQALQLYPNKPFCWNAQRWERILSSGIFRKVFQVTPERCLSSSSDNDNDDDDKNEKDSAICLHIIAEESPHHTLEYGISRSLYNGGWEGELDYQQRHIPATFFFLPSNLSLLSSGDDVLAVSLKRGANDPEPSVRVTYRDDRFGGLLGGGYEMEVFNDYIGVSKAVVRRGGGGRRRRIKEIGGQGRGIGQRFWKRVPHPTDASSSSSSPVLSPTENNKRFKENDHDDHDEEEEEDYYGPGEDLLVRKGFSFKLRDPFSSFVSQSDVSACLERTSTRTGERETLCSSTLGFGPVIRQSDDDEEEEDDEGENNENRGSRGSASVSALSSRVSLSGSLTLGGRLFNTGGTEEDENDGIIMDNKGDIKITSGDGNTIDRGGASENDNVNSLKSNNNRGGGIGVTKPYLTCMATSRQIFPLFQDTTTTTTTPSSSSSSRQDENNKSSPKPTLAFRQTLRFSTSDLPRHEANAIGFASRVRGYHYTSSSLSLSSSSSSSTSSKQRSGSNWMSLFSPSSSRTSSSSSSGSSSSSRTKCRPISSCIGGTAELRIPVNLPSLPFMEEKDDSSSSSSSSSTKTSHDGSVIFFADWLLASPWKSSSSSSSLTGKNDAAVEEEEGEAMTVETPFQRSSVGIGLRKMIRGIPIKYDICVTRDGRVGAFFGLGRDFDVV